ncbi:YeeE/YedE thiosulfate transporter family protein [uncultured Zoogloea sp.]|uniref:YeeE/YedE family protein n=1 Tax=uncultured Zoogloea sp. TaxID=160237 RepID=UPI0026104549|nr:YeeE/YedE thiosulfate transporter family protein [uncultured Zoogloea sp.]
MSIAWTAFTPGSALAGGALIGLAASVLWLVNGRVAGISGILGGLRWRPGDRGWRLAFVAGLLAAPAVLGWVAPGIGEFAPAGQGSAEVIRLFVAGLLVGVGTRLANGCTSGHGVCGLARLSPRSLAAVAVFMGTAFAVVFIARHLIGVGL